MTRSGLIPQNLLSVKTPPIFLPSTIKSLGHFILTVLFVYFSSAPATALAHASVSKDNLFPDGGLKPIEKVRF